jgi:hypothetical protein
MHIQSVALDKFSPSGFLQIQKATHALLGTDSQPDQEQYSTHPDPLLYGVEDWGRGRVTELNSSYLKV